MSRILALPWGQIIDKPSTFAPAGHTHDDRYYTESEITALLASYVLYTGATGNLNLGEHSLIAGAATFELGANNYAKFKGTGNYLTTIGGTDGIPGIHTNGYISINGDSTSDPLSIEIVPGLAYMLGISTDIGASPVVVIKGSSGNIFQVYDGGNNLKWSIATDGSANFGDTNSIFWIGKNIPSQAGLKFNNGRIESFFGGETYPRYALSSIGSLTLSLDGTTAPEVNGVRFRNSSGDVALGASNGVSIADDLVVKGATGNVLVNRGYLSVGAASPSDKIDISGGASGSYGLSIGNYAEGGGTKTYLRFDRDNLYTVLGSLAAPGSGTVLALNTLVGGTPGNRVAIDSAGDIDFSGSVDITGSTKLGIKTIATLPSAASSSGERYQVSDSATVANRIAFSNGSAWYYEGTAVAV